MSILSPPVLHRLDLACKHIHDVFGRFNGPYLVGSVQERTAGPNSDVDLRLILDDEDYDTLMAGTPDGFATLLDFALSAYVREMTGLPIDFQVQRQTEANANHSGKQRNPLGGRSLTNWIGDARPTTHRDTNPEPSNVRWATPAEQVKNSTAYKNGLTRRTRPELMAMVEELRTENAALLDLAERVRVVEGERDAESVRLHVEWAKEEERTIAALARAESAEAAHATLVAKVEQVVGLAKVQARSCQAAHRADHARNWLDVLALLDGSAS